MLSQVIRATYRRIHGTQAAHYTKLRKPGLLLGLGGLAAAGLGLQVSADAPESADDGQQLPTDKLACRIDAAPPRRPTVLVACGSFNPPTIMHLRMFDLATAALAQRGYDVWGCYMSPVADAYGKKGLAPVQQRLQMCRLAAADTSNVMVDSWEATQPGYTRTIQVLRHVSDALAGWMQQASHCSHASQAHAAGLAAAATAAAAAAAATGSHPAAAAASGPTPPSSITSTTSNQPGATGSSSSSTPAASTTPQAAAAAAAAAPLPRVMLLCGADLLATIAQPGVWVEPDVILRDHGIVCICRQGTDVEQLLQQPGTLLHQYRDNIIIVEEPVPNQVSSTAVRQQLAQQQPVRYLVPDAVIAFIKQHRLYQQQQQQQQTQGK